MHGNGTAKAVFSSTRPSPANASMSSVVRRRTSGSRRATSLGREERVEELAELDVLGRIDLERDERPHVAESDRVHVGGVQVGVPQRRHDLGVIDEQHLLVVGADHGGAGSHRGVDGLRARVHGRIQQSVTEGPRFGHATS